MELELRQEQISCWENVFQTTLNQEGTLEMIVPDACPDILQILDGEGSLFVQRKEATDGQGSVTGEIRVSILYQPDGGNGLCCMDAVLPFRCTGDDPRITRRCSLQVLPQIQSIDIRLLNPRKVLIRANYSLTITAYLPGNLSVAGCAERPENFGLCQKTGEFQTFLAVAVQDKTFTYSDTLSLPSGHPGAANILRTKGECACSEAKIIGNKLVMKGEVELELLCLSADNEIRKEQFQIPFSQIMDANEAGEEAVTQVTCLITELMVKPEDTTNGQTVSVDLELLVQAVMSKTAACPMLQDLYSTDYGVEAEQKVYSSDALRDTDSAVENVREVLETGVRPESIFDILVRPGKLSMGRDGGELSLGSDTEVCVLILGEDGNLYAVHRRMAVSHRIMAMDQLEYRCELSVNKKAAVITGSGIEVSFSMEFRWTVFERRSVTGVARATLDESKKRDSHNSPNLVVRPVREGENLWDIAKAYYASGQAIQSANQLPSEELFPGQMLLIPRQGRKKASS